MAKITKKEQVLHQRAHNISVGLEQTYGNAECALNHRNAFELLVATILSAQCTDERVNAVTPKLFGKYPTSQKLAEAEQEDVEKIVHSLGFFRAKANNIRGMAQQLVELYEGEVPADLEQLIALPGIGRKTANVVLGTAFGIASGVVVDTHVKRLTRLMGLTTSTTPEKIERDLMQLVPSNEWVNFSHRLIHHGRKICIARRPQCTKCPLIQDCLRVGLPPLSAESEQSA
ncbi:MAG: endonuclease III [Planctomycetota bacterium]